MKLPLNPGMASFPIFWFPLIAPLFLSALGVFGDLISSSIASSGALQVFVFVSSSSLKNIHLAYASIDIWALTEFTTAAAAGRLLGWQVWAYVLAAVIGLLFHMSAYLIIAILGSSAIGLVLGVVLFLIGTYGTILIRGVVFSSIEIADMRQLNKTSNRGTGE